MKTMDKQTINDWGWAPLVVGFFVILITIFIFLESLNPTNYTFHYTAFTDFWFPLVSFLFIAGAFLVVIGAVYLRNIRSKWSYASITAGFSLLAIDMFELIDAIKTLQGEIDWGDFQQYWSLNFFSGLMAAGFLIVVGIILGLKLRNKLGYVIITGGFALMAVGVTVLASNLVTTLDYYPPHYYVSLQEAWNTAISYFLIIGALIVVIGTGYLTWARNRNSP
jgi:hypothetical protein